MSNNQKKLNNKFIIIAIILSLMIILAAIFTIAYSKFSETVSNNATAQVAKFICEMEVEKSEASETVINPYCVITVKNYSGNDVAETDVNYTLEVVPTDNIALPEFYWKNASGTIIARSQDVTDANNNVIARTAQFPTYTFEAGVQEESEFTIVFLNTGEEEILRYVDFNLIAVQGRPE